MSEKQLGYVEAHEKGHLIRQYVSDSNFLKDYFSNGFDQFKVVLSEADYMGLKSKYTSEYTYEDATKELLDYLFSGVEIIERMAQLKNYFGMEGDEQFTKEHLDYARMHYLADTNMDNFMTYFFSGITPETEEAFLELINTSGV